MNNEDRKRIFIILFFVNLTLLVIFLSILATAFAEDQHQGVAGISQVLNRQQPESYPDWMPESYPESFPKERETWRMFL